MRGWLKDLKQRPFLQTFITSYQASEMDMSSIAIAYYMLVSLFPIVLLVVNILPYLHLDVNDLLGYVMTYIPATFHETVAEFLTGLLTEESGSLLSISILSAAWAFSKCLFYLQKAINKAYQIENPLGTLFDRVIALIASFGVFLVLFLGVLLSMFGQSLLRLAKSYLPMSDDIYQLLLRISQPVIVLAIFLAITLLYYILPDVEIKKLRHIVWGSVVTTAGLVLSSKLIDVFFSYYAKRMSAFKILSTIFILAMMLLFIYMSKLLILGAVLNASIQKQAVGEFQPRRRFLERMVEKLRNK